MVATLLAVLAVSPFGVSAVPSFDQDYVTIGKREIEIEDNGQKVKVEADVEIAFGGVTFRKTDETAVYRTIRVRPESPGPLVSVPGELIGRAGGGEVDGAMAQVFFAARAYGAPVDICKWVVDNLPSTSTPGSFTDNPNRDLKPGGWTEIEYSRDRLMASAQVVIRYAIRSENGGRFFEQERVSVPIAYLWSSGRRSNERFFPDQMASEELQVSMGGVTIQPGESDKKYTLTLPTYPIGENGFSTAEIRSINSLEYLRLFNESNGQDRISEILKEGGIDFNRSLELFNAGVPVGSDMNRMRFPVVEGDPCRMDFSFPAGTMWVPDTPGYQTMTTGDAFRLNLGFRFSDLYASTQIAGFDERTMFTMCLNMDLKEPDGKVRYFAYRPSDPVISALTGITDRSMRKGPIDQARMWIYTDKASMEKLNQRLLPRMTRGSYTRALFDVVKVGGFSSAEAVRIKMLVPEAVSARFLGKDAAGWAVETLGQHSPEELGKYLATGPEDLVAKATGESYDKEELVEVMASTLNSPQPAVRAGALVALEKIGDRSALKDKVGSLRLFAYSSDASVQAKVLEMLPTLRSELPKDVLEYLAERGATEDIKAKAKSLSGLD